MKSHLFALVGLGLAISSGGCKPGQADSKSHSADLVGSSKSNVVVTAHPDTLKFMKEVGFPLSPEDAQIKLDELTAKIMAEKNKNETKKALSLNGAAYKSRRIFCHAMKLGVVMGSATAFSACRDWDDGERFDISMTASGPSFSFTTGSGWVWFDDYPAHEKQKYRGITAGLTFGVGVSQGGFYSDIFGEARMTMFSMIMGADLGLSADFIIEKR